MRLPDWDVRLANWAGERLGAPFAWGQCDCAILTAEALECLDGEAHADAFRGRYASALGALRLQADQDIDLARGLAARGAQIVPAGYQQRGDILVVMQDGFACGHICFGERCLAVHPDQPVFWCDTSAVLAAGAVVYRMG